MGSAARSHGNGAHMLATSWNRARGSSIRASCTVDAEEPQSAASAQNARVWGWGSLRSRARQAEQSEKAMSWQTIVVAGKARHQACVSVQKAPLGRFRAPCIGSRLG